MGMFSSTPICHQVLWGHSGWHPLILLDLLLLIFVCIIFFNESDRDCQLLNIRAGLVKHTWYPVDCDSESISNYLHFSPPSYLKTSRIHFEARQWLLLRISHNKPRHFNSPVHVIKRNRQYLTTVLAITSFLRIRDEAMQHTLVIIPLHVTISASHFFPVSPSKAMIVLNRASRCSSAESSSFWKVSNPIFKSAGRFGG